MSKKNIIIIFLIMLSIGIVSLYSTFAYDEENATLPSTNADYNLIYSISDNSNKKVTIEPNEDIYIDITLKNIYNSTIKYGMYYYVIGENSNPKKLQVTLSEDSVDLLENIIKPNKTRSISLKISNQEDYEIELIVGALVGFENGKIEELVKNGEILIK